MEEEFSAVGPNTTMAELTMIAAYYLLNKGMGGFDFDVPGEGPSGEKISLHFECKVVRHKD